MAHVTGETTIGEQIYLAHSKDGLHWTDLNHGAPVLLSTVGERGVRDPAIVRSPGGDRYWIIATDLRMSGSGRSWSDASNNGSKSLVVWESTDLVNWSAPRLLDVAGGIPTAGDAWAPEAIHDPVSGTRRVVTSAWPTRENSMVSLPICDARGCVLCGPETGLQVHANEPARRDVSDNIWLCAGDQPPP